MAKTYADYLKENGATDDEVKILDVPAARKVYEAQVKAAADAAAAAADAAAKVAAYDKWYQEVAEPTATQLKNERDVAKAEADAERARLKSLQEAGLVKMEEKKAADAAAAAATPFDPKAHNLVTSDVLREVAMREGDAIAIAQDIAYEHSQLFPGRPLNFRKLREEALASKKSVEQMWMEKYDVAATREKREAEAKSAYEKKIADEAVAKYRSENENPLTRPGVASTNPFTQRKTGTDGKADVLPWQGNLNERSNDRVNKALQSLQQKNII